jgi:hypothetical protein
MVFDAWAFTERTDAPPELTWRRWSDGHRSSGTAFWDEGRIVVTAGRHAPRWEQKCVLLHEVAHMLHPHEHHSAAFWLTAWRLYRWFGLPIRKTLEREVEYRKGARAAYLATRP